VAEHPRVNLPLLFEKPDRPMGAGWQRENGKDLLLEAHEIAISAHAGDDLESTDMVRYGSERSPAPSKDQAIEILQPTEVVGDATLRATAAKFVLRLFGFSVVATFALIVFWGMGYLHYPESFLKWLGVATIGEVATVLGLVVKYLFPPRH
jgi:hypothetical protein